MPEIKRWNFSSHSILHVGIVFIFVSLWGCMHGEMEEYKLLPPPPEGFKWHKFEEVDVTVLAPENWCISSTEKQDLYIGTISEKSVDNTTTKTCFIVQVMDELMENKEVPASKYADILRKRIIGNMENSVIKTAPPKKRYSFSTSLIQFTHKPASEEPITCHTYFVAHDVNNRLYIFSFESPNKSWSGNYKKYCVPMMENIMIDFEE